MEIFKLYLQLGFQHIADFVGYDHILFISVLCAVYPVSQWKKILLLITAFTVGHTATLALSSLNLLNIQSKFIEFLIPVTIFITAGTNILQKREFIKQKSQLIKYMLALFFGLIHGLGFSNYLRSLLGQEENILCSLFAFNIGIELGQIIIVLGIVLFSFLIVLLTRISERTLHVIFSIIGMVISLVLIVSRFPWK